MKAAASEQKLRGGYYTPTPIAQFLTDWAIRSPSDRVLEPSAGDGVFTSTAVQRLLRLGAIECAIDAVEIDAEEAAKVRASVDPHGGRVHRGDFFAWARKALRARRSYSAILGNPPFLRFQHFQAEHRDIAFALMREQGLTPTKLTNSWMPFVTVSTALLEPGGRLAMVLPAELMQVSYAAPLRKFLADSYRRVTVHAFDRLVFPGIQQEVVLLTAEKTTEGPEGIRMIEVGSAADLQDHQHDWSDEPLKVMDHDTEKWTQYFLSVDELALVRNLRASGKMTRLGDLADVDVGVVTGMNDFFVVDANGSTPAELKSYAVPIVTRSNQLLGARVTDADWDGFYESGHARLLLAVNEDTPRCGLLDAYLSEGEERDVHKGYKCSIRRKWYVVPSRWQPDGFMLRQVHTYPRLALNGIPATSTDTVHRLRFTTDADRERIASAFHNVATFLLAELFGRSYGGGVLELEPTEAENLLLPPLKPVPRFSAVDAALREGDADALIALSSRSLRASLDLTQDDLGTLTAGWRRLRDRRLHRNRGGRPAKVATP